MDELAQAQKEQGDQAGQSPNAQRAAYATLKTCLIEKSAKLGSSIARLRSDLAQPEMGPSLMEGEDLAQTIEAAGSIKLSWGQLVSLPSQGRSPALSLPLPPTLSGALPSHASSLTPPPALLRHGAGGRVMGRWRNGGLGEQEGGG